MRGAQGEGAITAVRLVSILGDVDQNSVVDSNDISGFVSILLAGEYLAEADLDQDGVVDFNDIPEFVAILLG